MYPTEGICVSSNGSAGYAAAGEYTTYSANSHDASVMSHACGQRLTNLRPTAGLNT